MIVPLRRPQSGITAVDFPFYDGRPVQLSAAQWAWVLGMLVLGYVALVAPLAGEAGAPVLPFIQALLFCGLPLLGLRMVAPGQWTSIMRAVSARSVLWMITFGVLNIVVSLLAGWLLSRVFDFSPNALVAGLSHASATELQLTLLRTLPQLLGEELLTILPFLALLSLAHRKLGLSRRSAIILAWIVSALIFGAAHLPTYQWNLVQAIGVIGIARLVLTLAYIKTGNLWVSFGAHVVTDWTYFWLSLELARGSVDA